MPTVLRRRNQACCAGLPVRPSRMMADVKGSSSTGTPCALGDRISVPRRTNSPCLERSAPSHGEVSQTASKIPVRERADRGLPAHRDETGPTDQQPGTPGPGSRGHLGNSWSLTSGPHPATRTPTQVANVMNSYI